jgi:hypothetical protein
VPSPAPVPSQVPVSLAGQVARRIVDAPLAALAWLLLERGVPLLVAGVDADPRDELLGAVVAALPAHRRPGGPLADGRVVRVAGSVGAATAAGILRAALAATTGRSGLVAAVDAADLAGVLEVLGRQGLSPDEVSFLGVVLVVGSPEGDGPSPAVVTVAHYLRPVVRDAGGHPRRLPPAVLAAWDPAGERWEDFSWGIVPDLAERLGVRPGDLEAERDRRAAYLLHVAAHDHHGVG